jgi:hypothetical protein
MFKCHPFHENRPEFIRLYSYMCGNIFQTHLLPKFLWLVWVLLPSISYFLQWMMRKNKLDHRHDFPHETDNSLILYLKFKLKKYITWTTSWFCLLLLWKLKMELNIWYILCILWLFLRAHLFLFIYELLLYSFF